MSMYLRQDHIVQQCLKDPSYNCIRPEHKQNLVITIALLKKMILPAHSTIKTVCQTIADDGLTEIIVETGWKNFINLILQWQTATIYSCLFPPLPPFVFPTPLRSLLGKWSLDVRQTGKINLQCNHTTRTLQYLSENQTNTTNLVIYHQNKVFNQHDKNI